MANPILKSTILLMLALPVASPAWGPEGHAVVGDVAASLLTPEARRQVRSILGRRKLGDYEVACWPDVVRGDKEYDERYPRNGQWHFIEFNATEKYDADFELKPPEDGNDVATQIGRWQRELAKRDHPVPLRRDALKFLVHFVGDVHQPLHCAYRYGDMGGNMIPVRSFRGRQYSFGLDGDMEYVPNIHSVWDESMVLELMGGRTRPAFAKWMKSQIGPEPARKWRRGTPLDWAIDSYWRARKEAYRWGDGTSLPFKWSGPGMELTSGNYVDARLPMAQEQLLKAGVRLAHLINAALDPAYPPQDERLPER